MSTEVEVAEAIRALIEGYPLDDNVILNAELGFPPENEAGFFLTQEDGTKFLVTVTKIEEGV